MQHNTQKDVLHRAGLAVLGRPAFKAQSVTRESCKFTMQLSVQELLHQLSCMATCPMPTQLDPGQKGPTQASSGSAQMHEHAGDLIKRQCTDA